MSVAIMDIVDSHRRKWLGLGMAAVGLGLLPSHAFASLANFPTENSSL
ncbi:hypothetical protein ACU42Y_09780 [Proteus mirabilis]